MKKNDFLLELMHADIILTTFSIMSEAIVSGDGKLQLRIAEKLVSIFSL
jgi:hypothetical protein